MTPVIPFDNSYARLPQRFYAAVDATPVRAPTLIRLNEALALDLGLSSQALASPGGVAVLAGNARADGAAGIAMAYAGHQFGGFVPQLGDGRALLIGEVIDRQGRRRDIQLKGSGPTPFSRRGDGRAALGPVLREYIVSEAMHALGIPATRALAAVLSGEPVWRESLLPGGILTRVAASHIRVGTFQYFAAREDTEALGLLVDHVIARHYPDAAGAADRAGALLEAVIGAQAQLVARWMLVGFVHGVMNTDNMAVSGETIDFGPCAFMEAYDPATVFSSIDATGRYAFGNQPRIAQWNLARLAETLLPLMGDDDAALARANAALSTFPDLFQSALLTGWRAKLGLSTPDDADVALIDGLLSTMAANRADFTLTFRHLAAAAEDPAADNRVAALFETPQAFHDWAGAWRTRLAREAMAPHARAAAMRTVNPAFIPRNHRVEEAIEAAVQRQDFAPFHRLVDVLARPFDDQPDAADLMRPARPDEAVTQTFCGT
jgi:uncharacterized protein YdiU (UPF0061 family)